MNSVRLLQEKETDLSWSPIDADLSLNSPSVAALDPGGPASRTADSTSPVPAPEQGAHY